MSTKLGVTLGATNATANSEGVDEQHFRKSSTHTFGRKLLLAAASFAVLSALPNAAIAQEDEEESRQDTVVVTGSLRALPVEDVGSVFGFDKTLTEIPRSASTISSDQIERFGITDIYGLVAQAPGTFTNSFFGVGGALDIRGQAGETYFRGVRRLDNPGNYPTPIGASDRVDIVRGPASPIYGPSKSGGYMNFVPKSARNNGEYLAEPEGEIRYTGGSWDKSVLSASITGPGNIGGQKFGYTLYGEIEDSGSFYDNISTEQTILQAAFETELTDSVRLEFGTMYHDYDGIQNGGWNRLTQDLVDNGTYVTGSAQPLDTDGDGQISPAEFDAVGPHSVFGAFACGGGVDPSGWTDACFQANYGYLALDPSTVGTTTLDRSKTLAGEDDTLENEMITYYFDVIWEGPGDLEIKNQMFYEAYENLNENSYGFSQFHDSWVFENKLVVTKPFEFDGLTLNTQLSPSVRHTDFLHGDDFSYEYFHRVDLTQGYDPLSNRLLSTESGLNYDNYVSGDYTNLALAALADAEFDFGLGLLLGVRYDTIDAESTADGSKQLDGTDANASDTENGISWNVSANYKLPGGFIPYVTVAEQSVVVAGQGAELAPSDLAAGAWFSATELTEVGIKGDFLDGRLYAAISYYDQKRTDRNIQSSTVNQDIETDGIEAEVRWAPTEALLLTGSYTSTTVTNATYAAAGSAFSFFGAEDMTGVTDHSLHYGGQPIGLNFLTPSQATRAGIPEELFTLTGTYSFENGLSLSGSVVDVPSVYSGQSQVVELPGYTLVDLSASYEVNDWLFRVSVNNATDEEYFRANFTELFGSTIVLPEKPRSVQASVIYKF
ncbi:MAG: TonB-dependent receptor [Ponticaulis sp.]|nr:TonB-dependent receptor [Ponticaulis sp.]